MKITVLAIFGIAMTSSLAAADSTRQWLPTPFEVKIPDGTIAELREIGGFVAPGTPNNRGIRIQKDGSVISFEGATPGEIKQVATLGKIAEDRLNALQAALDQTYKQEGPLSQINPQARACADAPAISYTARRSDGTSVTYHEEIDCIEFAISGQGEVWALKPLLDSFEGLSHLK